MSFLTPRIDLFKFTETKSGRVFRLTNSNKDAKIGDETYIPAAINRTEVVHSEELEKNTLRITLPITNEMARKWIFGATEEDILVTLFSQKGNDTKAIWRGRLSKVSPNNTSIELEFTDLYSSINRNGLGLSYTRNCRHNLYSNQCGVKASSNRTSGTVTSIQGEVVTVSAASSKDNGYFSGGYLETSIGSRHLIVKHIGSTLTLLQPVIFFQNASNSRRVNIYAGCNKTTSDCKNKFKNLSNFGGFPLIPSKGIYDGTTIIGV
jgi:uncharacterized phage protein (TIGR02218 family)